MKRKKSTGFVIDGHTGEMTMVEYYVDNWPLARPSNIIVKINSNDTPEIVAKKTRKAIRCQLNTSK